VSSRVAALRMAARNHSVCGALTCRGRVWMIPMCAYVKEEVREEMVASAAAAAKEAAQRGATTAY